MTDPYRCPECCKVQHVLIENDLCVQCHDRVYREAVLRCDDETARSIVREYRMTARTALDALAPKEKQDG